MRPPDAAPARLFDGDAIPRLADAPDFRALDRRTADGTVPRGPVALLGEIIDVQARSAALRLPRAPGRNLAVLGTRVDEACAVLDAAARSLAGQHPPGTARFSIACLDPDADPAARALYDDLADDAAWYDEETVAELMAETADGLDGGAAASPHYLLPVRRRRGRRPRWPREPPAHRAGAPAADPARRPGAAHPRAGLVAGVARMRADLGGPAVADRPDRRLGGAGRARRRAGRRAVPGPAAARTGIPGPGGGSSSTARCTAPAR